MVLNSGITDSIGQASLDEFDIIGYMGFSDSSTPESASSVDLTDEFLRKILSVKSKDTVALTYEFDAALGLTESNGEILQQFGLFASLAGSDLKLSRVLDVAVNKTSDREINVGYQIAVEVIDETA